MTQNNIFLNSLPAGADALEVGKIAQTHKGGLIHVALDDKHSHAMESALKFFYPNLEIYKIPAWDCLPYDRVSPNLVINGTRISSLIELITKRNYLKTVNFIILTTVNALIQKLPPADILQEKSFIIKVGEKLEREDLIKYLINFGYINVATANDVGEFAVRGSIIDIFPSGLEYGVRLDFFGNVVENIRSYDPLTQISANKLPEVKFIPSGEVILDDRSVENFKNNYRGLFGAVTGDDPLYESVMNKRHYAGMEHWLPLFYEHMSTIFDYVPSAIISFDHHAFDALNAREEQIKDFYSARIKNYNLLQKNKDDIVYKAVPPGLLYLEVSEIEQLLTTKDVVNISPFLADSETIQVNAINLPYEIAPDLFNLAKNNFIKKSNTGSLAEENITVPTDVFADDLITNPFELLKSYQQNLAKQNVKILIACYSEGSLDRMKNLLLEHEITGITVSGFADFITSKKNLVHLTIAEFGQGFRKNLSLYQVDNKSFYSKLLAFDNQAILLLTEQELLGERLGLKRISKKRAERLIFEAENLTKGELVVHKEHGIARFAGLETIKVTGISHDCLLLIYENNDRLYVPVENIDVISRYGGDAENAKLDRLGTVAWQERKARMKKRIKMLAEELMKVAAQRALKTAPIMPASKGSYEEFCSGFPYAETDDQLRSIEEVEADLASGKPMDRLICGDVGFGKTEIALRAAFIAADNGYQVVVICPTTLLARQHSKTFRTRFANFPFNVRSLSRLIGSKEALDTKLAIKEGKTDIVIGTHALLSSNIEFKKLGLVIIDEEQLFGVKQKERLKQLKSDIHVLTLSATPIPRTLQMSLTGIKDLSLITTPPVDRLAIRSYIMPYDQIVIRNAILREHYRGGRSFYVAPKISDLDDIIVKLKELVPEIKIAKAHGKLSGPDLDAIMNDFYDGKFDLLVSTNIIGSGLDVASANTIIVHRADLFGLAQLYQMRGRVGRGKIRAYAYFTTLPKMLPSETAVKRLEVISNLDSLGAGFTLASHDMDIRGFGNMLGEEQSGQVREVGVELYQEMLKEAVYNAKIGQVNEVNERASPEINLGIEVLIPEDYIKDIELRLSIYKELAGAASNNELHELKAGMIDRFGQVPDAVNNLIDIMLIKQQCLAAGISKVDAGPKAIVISFYDNKFANPERLIDFISKNPLKMKIRGDMKLVFMEEISDDNMRVQFVKRSLDKIKDMVS